jgi:hypothetical protein
LELVMARILSMTRRAPAIVAAVLAVVTVTGAAHRASTTNPKTRRAQERKVTAPRGLDVRVAPWRLGAPVSREVVLNDNKKILVFGGQDLTHNSTATATAVDPINGAATPLGALSPAVHDAAGARIGQTNLVIAGGSPPPRADVQIVPTSGTAHHRGELPAARTDHVSATIRGAVYVLGGAQDEGSPISSVLVTTDAGASWQDAGNLSQPARYPAVAVLDNAIYLFGGVTTANGLDTTAIQRYDPKKRTTTVVAQLPAPLSHATAVTFHGITFILGGYVNNVPSNQILRFDPHAAAVTQAGALPAPLTDSAATVIANVGYLVGGEGPGRTTTADVEVLTPH